MSGQREGPTEVVIAIGDGGVVSGATVVSGLGAAAVVSGAPVFLGAADVDTVMM